jgi:hypothetical protein
VAFHPGQQQRLVTDRPYSPQAAFSSGIITKAPWDSVIDFATHPSFCGMTLYPRQQTLLRLMFLETDQMTDFDRDVIEEWRRGFTQRREVFGVQPDIWERVAYLKERGFRRFPEIQAVLGRRASKGMIGGILGAEQMAYLFSLDDWQSHYGVVPGKDGYLTVVATSQSQAKRHQFRDIAMAIENCAYLQPHIASSKDYELSIRTPADLRRIGSLKAAGMVPDHEIATLHAIAMASNSDVVRGAASFALFLDEFAFMVQGTGSSKSGEEVYESAVPSLDQFDPDALIYIPSSPWCLEPDTKVLTEDLRWVPVKSVQVGDRLIGFDEECQGQGKGRTWRPAVVTESTIIHAPRYEMTMKSGKKIVCTGEHMWLGRRSQTDYQWIKTSKLKPGDKIKTLGVDPWEPEETYDAGWLSGFFDGEGHLSAKIGGANGLTTLGYAQIFGPIQERAELLLKERGYEVKNAVGHADRGDRAVAKARIYGGTAEILRFLGTVRPQRLLNSFPQKFYGGRIYGRLDKAIDHVVSVKQVQDGPVVALGTSTNTLVAEGLLSHNTKIGQFFALYKQGSVLMRSYTEKEGVTYTRQTEESLGVDAEAEIVDLTADPVKLVFQGPSWILYQDWERGPELVGRAFKRAIQPDLTSEVQQRRMRRNPEKFRVERMGQFAEVAAQYLDPDKVEAMFAPLDWREPLVSQSQGRFDRSYRIHCDPGRTGANFAMAVGHLEDAPCNGCGWTKADGGTGWASNAHICPEGGSVWPHVIMDLLHVWKPSDFPADAESGRRTIDYIQVGNDIKDVLTRFRSTEKISFDQWNSAYFLADLKQQFSPGIRVTEVTFTDRVNQERYEKFKSAMNLGWVSSYRDHFFDNGSLLEQELKFLSEKNGKVVKQDFGPVTTKDLADCVQVVTVDLLHEALDRWAAGTLTASAYGSSDTAGLRTGREFERMGFGQPGGGGGARRTGRAWQDLERQRKERGRSGFSPDRASSIRSRRG